MHRGCSLHPKSLWSCQKIPTPRQQADRRSKHDGGGLEGGVLQWLTLHLIRFLSVYNRTYRFSFDLHFTSLLTRWRWGQKTGRRNLLTSLHSLLFWHKLTDNQGVFKVKQGQGSHVWGDSVLQHNSEGDGIWWLDPSVSPTCCFGLNNTSMAFNSNKTSSVSLRPVCCYYASIV